MGVASGFHFSRLIMTERQRLPRVSGRVSAITCALILCGCSGLHPKPMGSKDLLARTQADALEIRKDVAPIHAPLTLEEALARALKYNLDRRAKLMEESLALGQLDVTKFDMLPKWIQQAGYSWRDNERISNSRDPATNTAVPNRFISSDREHYTKELGASWSLLDVALGYYGSKQQANRYLIASEKRRKALHLLMQDVRSAFWRAASAQLLKDDVAKIIALAEEALSDSRTAAEERVKAPLDALRYQRQLLENLRLLSSIEQELSSAQVDLAYLINAPVGQPIRIAEGELKNTSGAVLEISIERLEEAALAQNAELREQHYNARIAREEARRTLIRLFPNVVFNYGTKYDSDSYLVNRVWTEAGAQLSFNIFNLLTGPTQLKLAKAGVKLADQRRVATQMGVIAQVHLARMNLVNAKSQFERANEIYNTDKKISDLMRNREAAQAQSKLDMVSNETATILSLLRRYQALAQVQTAENRLVATLGVEPPIGSTHELELGELKRQLKKSLDQPWGSLGAKAGAPAESPKKAAVKAAAHGEKAAKAVEADGAKAVDPAGEESPKKAAGETTLRVEKSVEAGKADGAKPAEPAGDKTPKKDVVKAAADGKKPAEGVGTDGVKPAEPSGGKAASEGPK